MRPPSRPAVPGQPVSTCIRDNIQTGQSTYKISSDEATQLKSQSDPTCLFFIWWFPPPLSWKTRLPSACPRSPHEPTFWCLQPPQQSAIALAGSASAHSQKSLPALHSCRSWPLPSSPKHPESPMQRTRTWWQRSDSLFPVIPPQFLLWHCNPLSFLVCPVSTHLQTHLYAEEIPRDASSISNACVSVNPYHVSSSLLLIALYPVSSHAAVSFPLTPPPWQCKQGNSHLGDLIGIKAVTLSALLTVPAHRSLGLRQERTV